MPFSPDRAPPGSPLSPEAKRKMAGRIIKDLQKTIEPYERIYLSSDELASFQAAPFNKQRFVHFQAWIRQLSEQKYLPATWKIKQTQLEEVVTNVWKLYRALLDLAVDRSLATDIDDRYFERPLARDEFYLKREDIPDWTELPLREDLAKDYVFDWIWGEYKTGRKLDGFVLSERDLLNVGYAVDDLNKRQAFLDSVDPKRLPETLPPARIFEIGDLIKEKIKKDKDRPSSPITAELLEAFDAAGVRPATLPELLAYAKTNWKPKEDPSSPLSPEEQAQRANALCIHALGSVFLDLDGNGLAPHLVWKNDMRQLDAHFFGRYWGEGDRFLVFRKE